MGLTVSPDVFVGREQELALLGRLVTRVREGSPAAVLVEGEAGIGKTALVRQALSGTALEGFTVLRAFCDASESDHSYGVVSQLTRRVAAAGSDFPLLAATIPPSAIPFQVGAQLLALTDQLQEKGPVALLIDDVQWADRSSLQALSYVERRLEADAVLTVMTARTGKGALALGEDMAELNELLDEVRRWLHGLSQGTSMALEGLGASEVRHLAEQAAGHHVGRRTAGQLHAQTGGHPLYVQTILAELDDVGSDPGDLPVPSTLAQGLRRQLDALPLKARKLVEAVALLAARVPLTLAGQVAATEDPAEALGPALEAGLLRWWPEEMGTPVAIRHILQRQAVLTAMDPAEARSMHATAAGLVAERASWAHRVAATAGTDPGLATELEQQAGKLLDAADTERAATLLLWARDLAATRTERERLLLTATAHLLWIEKLTRTQSLLDQVRACVPCPMRDLVLSGYAILKGDRSQTLPMLTRAFDSTKDEPRQQWIAAMAGTWLGLHHLHNGEGARLEEVSRQVLAFDVPGRLTAPAKVYLAWGRGFTRGARAAIEQLNTLAPMPEIPERVPPAGDFLLMYRGTIRSYAGELAASVDDLAVAVRRAREGWHIMAMAAWAYSDLALAQFFLGAWDDAVISSRHALTADSAEDKMWASSWVNAIAAWVPAMRGQWQLAHAYLDTAEQWLPAGGRTYRIQTAVGRAFLSQAQADYPGMFTALQPLLQLPPEAGTKMFAAWWLPLYVEALTGTGQTTQARKKLADLQQLTNDIPYLHLVAARLAGQLAEVSGDVQAARAHYEQTLCLPATRDDVPLDRALLEHAAGRLLAATGDEQGAERRLSQARERLNTLHATPFVERCENDLAQVSPANLTPRRSKGLAVLTVLTDRERDIAHLVSQGMTNKEIGSELFVSAKTVEYHLSRIYQKLLIPDRRQLRAYILQTPSSHSPTKLP
ncbi:AAA family ATPase [Streptomyces sp. NPDC005529]|uniref:helix-turn-helix transcriptional regulator n=1 Tax=unclassified Streptomyces TaxID=2593676 RepID=UPI0033A35195